MSTPHKTLRSLGALLAGALTGILLSIGTDALLRAGGLFPPPGVPCSYPLLLLATVYRTVYGIGGSYIAARLAPDRPMAHAMVLGVLGMAANVAGTIATWNGGPEFAAKWYPISLVILALPTAWAGARLFLAQAQGSSFHTGRQPAREV